MIMSTFTNIRLALRLDELNPARLREEGYQMVVDTRGENGCARPAREALVKRLSNWRIDYVQLPVDFDANDHTAKARLEALLNDCNGTAVMVTNQVFAAQGYFLADSQAQAAVEGDARASGLANETAPNLSDFYRQPGQEAVSG